MCHVVGACRIGMTERRPAMTRTIPTADDAERELVLRGIIRSGMNFRQRIWTLTTRIAAGRVATYGQLASAAGSPHAARAVGQAMASNPYAPDVPCHRVVAGDGSLHGYSGAGGVQRKRSMLEAEGVRFRGARVDLERSGLARL